MEYLDFELDVGPADGARHPVCVLRSPAGEAYEMACPPKLAPDLNHSLQLARDISWTDHVPALRSSVKSFGAELFEAVFHGSIRRCFEATLHEALSNQQGVRIKLRLRAPEVAYLPWETIYDAERGYLALSRITLLSRYIAAPRPLPKLLVRPPLRVLGIISTPHGTPPLDVAAERELIEAATFDLRREQLIEIEWVSGAKAQVEHLQTLLQQPRPWHVVHFIGHGGFDETTQQGTIAFTDRSGAPRWIGGEQLGMLLHDHLSLRLVVLNCCRSAQSSEGSLFASTAAQIAHSGIPAVVAMQRAVNDRTAIAFAGKFYGAIASGLTVDAAVSEGRKAMSLEARDTEDIEWALPVLHMRSADGHLFDLGDQVNLAASRQAAPPPIAPQPHSDPQVEPMIRVERADIRAAIVGAYNRATFDRMLSDRFDFRRASHVADGSFTDIVDGVLDRFVEEGRESELIAQLAADRPAKREIQRIYRKYAESVSSQARRGGSEAETFERPAHGGLLPGVELQRAGLRHSTPVSTGNAVVFSELQRELRSELSDLDVLQWTALLVRQIHRVCRVEVNGTPAGNGFLIGPATVLTSYRVVCEAIANRARGAALGFLFGDVKERSGAEPGATRVAARATWEQWHIDSSPPRSAAEERAGTVGPRHDRLGHAVIQLEHAVGDHSVVPGGPNRGWISLPARPPQLSIGMPIAILHYPYRSPIKLTLDTRALQEGNREQTAIRYSTSTDRGSPGAPCLDLRLALVGVHQLSDVEHATPPYNQGVSIAAIYRRLSEQGKLAALGGEAP